LRGIGGFAELLKMHYESRLDKQGQDWLSRILHSAAQLQSLVRDLLQYSSIETQPLPTEAVAMNEVLDRVLRFLASAVQDTQATITHTDLPVVSGDASQLTQLLLNLISNAIKYRSSSSPNVHIAAERSTDTWVFSVRDNGIGIEPRHMERIFDLFERLHTAEQYQGTGIGLSICRRVVQRHGGNIWVESQLGIGSTFFFTLPIRPSLAQ
jgi:two-component system, chemotaxis family, sensor kinase Cph1